MNRTSPRKNRNRKLPAKGTVIATLITAMFALAAILSMGGCGGLGGYSNESLFPEKVSTVYVEMFDNRSFWRDVEYQLTDALAKRIESQTPYKIVSNRDLADTIISGQIETVSQVTLDTERQTGRALEKDIHLRAVVTWKNLKTGEIMVNHESAMASASYSEWMNQGPRYGLALAANNMATEIVELMEKKW